MKEERMKMRVSSLTLALIVALGVLNGAVLTDKAYCESTQRQTPALPADQTQAAARPAAPPTGGRDVPFDGGSLPPNVADMIAELAKARAELKANRERQEAIIKAAQECGQKGGSISRTGDVIMCIIAPKPLAPAPAVPSELIAPGLFYGNGYLYDVSSTASSVVLSCNWRNGSSSDCRPIMASCTSRNDCTVTSFSNTPGGPQMKVINNNTITEETAFGDFVFTRQ